MTRKYILTLFSVTLSLTIFVGCSTNKTNSSNTSTSSANVSNDSATKNDTTTKYNSVKESSTNNSEQKFNKKDTDILKDLKDANAGIEVVDASTYTLTYGKNDVLGYIPIQKINNFTISSIDPLTSTLGIVDDVILWKEVTIETDVDFEINDLNNMYERNGKYNGQGTFVLLYHLTKNKDNKLEWNYSSIKSLSSKFKITKK